MQVPKLLAAFGLAWCGLALAQLPGDDPDWKESEVPPPPVVDLARLVPFDVAARSEVRWGIDRASMAITKDGLVRYVVITQGSGGAVQGSYDAIRCATGEYKTYARYNPSTGWKAAEDPLWKRLFGARNSLYALALAQQGLCRGKAPAVSVQSALNSLASPDIPGR